MTLVGEMGKTVTLIWEMVKDSNTDMGDVGGQ